MPKCLGGLGFRDLGVFNEALLGRQAWRLVHGDNTLLGRVMKAKYYPHTSFLEAGLGYSTSYSWRSIWGVKALIKEGMVWRVGKGNNVRIWEDPWLISDDGRFILSERVEGLMNINDLIKHDEGAWDMEIITSKFNERDQKCILAIPLSMREHVDSIYWPYSQDGNYSTKTAYFLGKGCNLDNVHQVWVENMEHGYPTEGTTFPLAHVYELFAH